MKNYERLEKIRDYITEKGRASTQQLSEVFKVSMQTIRKDLKLLEENNLVKRIHGGAERTSTFEERLDINVEVKRNLCKIAAQYINDGDVVFIDGGTSYYYLIDYIPDNINITVVTASLPIAEKVKLTSDQDVYLLGGLVNGTTLETTSPSAIREISNMVFNKSFFGISGFSKDFSFTEDNYYSLDFKKKIKKNTSKSIVAASADKEDKVAFKKVFDFSEIDVFITERNISDDIRDLLMNQLSLIEI